MEKTFDTSITLLEAARTFYPDSSRRTLQQWIENGRFRIDGKPVKKANTSIEPGQKITTQNTFVAPKVSGLNILYEDRYFIVIDKPEGLLSVPLDAGRTKRHALGLLRESYDTQEIFAVHRIDRETSGILMFARGKESEERFDKIFENHDIEREYYAIVEGRVKDNKGSWHSKLLQLESLDVVESEEGKDAVTHYEVIRRSSKYTYLKLNLETGRKHQIRVQCQMAGHPIVGDDRYGSRENPMGRLALHACTLGFIHPFTGKNVRFTSPLPRVFEVLGGKRRA